MSCPSVEEIICYLDGELSLNNVRDIERHLEKCVHCANQRDQYARMLSRMEPAENEFDDLDVKGPVLDRIRSTVSSGTQVKPRVTAKLRLRLVLPALAAAACAAFAVLWFRGPEAQAPPTGFVARGGADSSDGRWNAFWIYQTQAGDSGYEQVQASIRPDAQLVFGYLNMQGAYGYLMVFGIDYTGNIFWYHPAYEKPHTDPVSVSIRAGRHELTEAVQHDLHPGNLRVYALFSQHALHVSEIEESIIQLKKAGTPMPPVELPLKETKQISHTLRVTEAEESR